jgi:hypothetical protein
VTELRWEKCYPYVMGVAAAAAYYIFLRNRAFPVHITSFFNAALTVSTIAVGFFATAKAIVYSVADTRRVIQALRKAGLYEAFLGYLTAAINWSFVLAGLTAIYLAFDFSDHQTWKVVLFGIWVFVATTSAFLYFRAIRVLSSTLDRHS